MDAPSDSIALSRRALARTKLLKCGSLLAWVLVVFVFQGPGFAQAQVVLDAVHLRFAHLSPDSPPFDVYIDGEIQALESLSFGKSSDWFEIAAGNYRIAIVPTGATVSDALIGPAEIVVNADNWQTIALIGRIEADSLRAQIITEDFSTLLAGEMRLSFFNAVENLPAVDLIVDGEVLVDNIAYPASGDAPANAGFGVGEPPTGLYSVRILESGEPDNVIVDLGEIELFANQNTLLALIGPPDNPQIVRFNTTISTQADELDANAPDLGDGSGLLRFAHFSSGTPDVDIYIDSALSEIQQLSFSDVTAYVEVPAGVYTINIAPVNTSLNDSVIGPLEVAVATGSSVTIAAIGTLANDTLTAQVFTQDAAPVSLFRVEVSIVHAIPGLGPVDVLVNDSVRVGLLGFPGSQGSNDGLATFDLVQGTVDIQIVLSEDPDEVLVDLPNIRLVADRRYLITLVLAEPPFLLTTTLVTLPSQ